MLLTSGDGTVSSPLLERVTMGANPNNAERKARTRAPAPVILRLRQDLAPNDNHPLAGLDPEQRNTERLKLIAAILARLANGQSSAIDTGDTMKRSIAVEGSGREQPKETR